jgi:hypothetical protein
LMNLSPYGRATYTSNSTFCLNYHSSEYRHLNRMNQIVVICGP